jgi:hypothetical protein
LTHRKGQLKSAPCRVRPGKNVGLTPVEANFTEVTDIDDSAIGLFNNS